MLHAMRKVHADTESSEEKKPLVICIICSRGQIKEVSSLEQWAF